MSFWGKNACFKVAILCVCGQAGGDGGVCWWVFGCVNEVCMEVTECGDMCAGGGGGCVYGGGVGWRVSAFWTSGIVYMLILTINMSIWPKSGLSKFWKNTLQMFSNLMSDDCLLA